MAGRQNGIRSRMGAALACHFHMLLGVASIELHRLRRQLKLWWQKRGAPLQYKLWNTKHISGTSQDVEGNLCLRLSVGLVLWKLLGLVFSSLRQPHWRIHGLAFTAQQESDASERLRAATRATRLCLDKSCYWDVLKKSKKKRKLSDACGQQSFTSHYFNRPLLTRCVPSHSPAKGIFHWTLTQCKKQQAVQQP